MKIAVCIKLVLDPDLPPQDFRLDPVSQRPTRGQAKLLISPFDENALETAIQLKERHGAMVTVLSLGPRSAEEGLRRALAMGADEAIRIDAPTDLDGAATAALLAGSLAQVKPDLVLVGRQAGDWDRGQVGPMLAEALGCACVTAAYGPEWRDGSLVVWREVPGGADLVDVTLPAVLAVTNHHSNSPRMPKVRDLLMASRRALSLHQVEDTLPDPAVELVELTIPAVESACEMLPGTDGTALATALVGRLREMRLL